MSHHKMTWMKNILLDAIECEMMDLEGADPAELGHAVDMLKDLEKAIYYETVTEAMKSGETLGRCKNCGCEIAATTAAETSTHHEHWGRSPHMREAYMESKMTHSDKAVQLRELEKYMQELTTDIVEMIQDSASEEKAYLEKKLTVLATKIGQMK